MKALLYGKNSKNIAQLIQDLGIEIVDSSPDVVISYGGDGTLLTSERIYPGIPKLPIRDSRICNKCLNHTDTVVLKKLLDKKLRLKEHRKLHINIAGKDLFALSDFVVRNSEPIHTIRFKIKKNNTEINKILIGDGVILATPFGSTGYFKSITNISFDHGFALAFNNITERKNPIYFQEDQNETLELELKRGKATLSFDNNPEIINLKEGIKLLFDLSDKVAKIYDDTSLRCPNCRLTRG